MTIHRLEEMKSNHKKKKKAGKTSEMMEGYCFVTSVTGLNRSNTGKTDDEDKDNNCIYSFCAV
jgi:hypothetical protein